jgi:hypothetical protein
MTATRSWTVGDAQDTPFIVSRLKLRLYTRMPTKNPGWVRRITQRLSDKLILLFLPLMPLQTPTRATPLGAQAAALLYSPPEISRTLALDRWHASLNSSSLRDGVLWHLLPRTKNALAGVHANPLIYSPTHPYARTQVHRARLVLPRKCVFWGELQSVIS